jgi:hypothetical protein
MNRCDSCEVDLPDPKMGLCYPCADKVYDRWLDRHDDIGPDE